MLDLLFIVATIVFFLISLAYVRGCDTTMTPWELILGSYGRGTDRLPGVRDAAP